MNPSSLIGYLGNGVLPKYDTQEYMPLFPSNFNPAKNTLGADEFTNLHQNNFQDPRGHVENHSTLIDENNLPSEALPTPLFVPSKQYLPGFSSTEANMMGQSFQQIQQARGASASAEPNSMMGRTLQIPQARGASASAEPNPTMAQNLRMQHARGASARPYSTILENFKQAQGAETEAGPNSMMRLEFQQIQQALESGTRGGGNIVEIESPIEVLIKSPFHVQPAYSREESE